jgi:hypothetical protein
MALPHFGGAGDGFLESFLRCFCMRVQPNRDISGKANAHGGGVENRAISSDNTTPFKLLNPPEAGRRGQAHAIRKIGVADPPVARKLSQYMSVYFVCICHLLCNLTKFFHKSNQIAPVFA